MSGYYFECPSCSKVHPIEPKPIVWFDIDRIDPHTAARLLRGDNVQAIPTIGGEGAVGSVHRLPLPDRKCEDCGQDGCVDCLPEPLCKTCAECPTCEGEGEVGFGVTLQNCPECGGGGKRR